MAIDKIVAEYRLELDGLKQDVNNLKGQLKSVDDSVNTSANNTKGKLDDIGNQVTGKLTDSFKKLGGAIVAAFAVERIGAFISSSIQLAAEVDDIKKAFDALNSPVLLSQLRAAVGGTVNDLELMKVALKANNFKIPLQDLAKMLQYAKQQSDLTGRSVQELSEIIIDSIGKGAARGLFELGVKQEDINAAIKETGSLYDGMFKVITDGLETAGEGYDSFADKQEQLKTNIENLQIKIGSELLPVLNNLLQGIYNVASGFGYLFNASEKHFKAGYDGAVEFATKTKMSLNDVNASIENYVEMLEAARKEQEEVNDKFFATPAQKRSANITVKVLEGGLQAYKDLAQQMSRENIPLQNDFTKEVKKTNKEVTATDKIIQENIKSLQDYVKLFGQPAQTAEGYEKIIQDNIKGLTEYVNLFATIPAQTAEGYNQTIQNNLNGLQDYVDLFSLGFVEANGDTLEDAKMQWQDYFYSVMRIADSVYTMFNALDDNRLENLKDRLERGLISQEQYDDELKKIQEEQARRQRIIAIFQAALDIPLAILKGLKDYGPVGAGIAAGVGFANLATILATSLPAFKDGVIDFKGKGTGTSDSNLALISRGESVITAKATRKHKDVLEAIQKDKFDEYVMQIYAKQIKEKQKDGVNHELQELLYRQLLISNKQIKEDKENTKEIVSAIEKRPHRF